MLALKGSLCKVGVLVLRERDVTCEQESALKALDARPSSNFRDGR